MTFTRNTDSAPSKVSQALEAKNARRAVRDACEVKCIHTGSSLLNLACADNPFGGFAHGTMINLIGDSSAGKTVLGLTCLAEAANVPALDNYRLIMDDVEAALLIDMPRMFGKKAAKRIEHWTQDNEKRSNDIYDFYANVAKLLDKGDPFIYLLDSMDAITTTEDEARVEQLLKDPEKVKGSYGMQKPKMLSEILRNICSGLYETKSILIIISQTREKTDATAFSSKKSRSGGKALKFYATHEIWLSVIETLKEEKYKRVLGAKVQAKVSKNKVTGKVREAVFPIYYDYGVDDIGSCADFLIQAKTWSSPKTEANKVRSGYYTCPLFPDQALTRNAIIAGIEEYGLTHDLQKMAGEHWMEIEEAIRLNRVPRFKD